MFVAAFLLTLIGAATLVAMIARAFGVAIGVGQPTSLLIVIAIGLVGLIVTLAGFMRRIASPLGEVVEAADRVSDGDYSVRVVERGPPFVRSAARAFNAMTERLHVQDRHRRQLMADIAHELRTPLTVMQGRIEGLLDGVYPRDDDHLSRVLEDSRVMARLIEDLRTLANAESGVLKLQREATDLATLIEDSVSAVAPQADERSVALRIAVSPDLPLVNVDPVRIREVLTNLLTNAVRHTEAQGRVMVAAEQAGDGRMELAVSDTGSGIAPEDLPHVFERFYKGRGSHGSGLGLTIARSLIVAHGGDITARSTLGQGTTMTISLPLVAGRGG
jgi:signal transduction histidine kinase